MIAAIEIIIFIYIAAVTVVLLAALFYDPMTKFVRWSFNIAMGTVVVVTIILVVLFGGTTLHNYITT